MSLLQVGVIGAGGFTDICHIPGINRHPHGQVVALCGRRLQNARDQADKHGIPRVYTDYRDLIADPAVQAVTIATPNVSHAPIALAAVAAGKPIFCEKPLGMNTAEAAQMTRAAEAAGIVHHTAFTFRHLFSPWEMRRRLLDGEIGEPFHVRVWGESGGFLDPNKPIIWRQQVDMAGTGILGDFGSHLIDLVHFVTGRRIQGVSAMQRTLYPHRPAADGAGRVPVTADDVTLSLFKLAGQGESQPPDGLLGASWVTPLHQGTSFLEIHGSRGALRCYFSRGETDRLTKMVPGTPETELPLRPLPGMAAAQAGKTATIVPEANHALWRMMGSFVEECLGLPASGLAREDLPTFRAGLEVQQVLDAMVTSAQESTWVHINHESAYQP